MSKTFVEAIKHRRSYYALSNQSHIKDEEIEGILETALHFLPSANNSQSTRLVLLLGDHHTKLWDIVKGTLKKQISEEAYINSEKKINKSFASGYGTVLFFEDTQVVDALKEKLPRYAETFNDWSNHTNAMHQLAIWTMLEDHHFGASLQHYNPIIDEEVKANWSLPSEWKLIAQMPFGIPLEPPMNKTVQPAKDRMKIFK